MDKFAIFRNTRLAFWSACVAALAIVFVSEYSYRKAVQSLDELGILGQARVRIQHLARGLVDAETGQRGYLLTGRQEYREQYENSVSATKEVLHQLDQHFEDAPAATKLIGSIERYWQGADD